MTRTLVSFLELIKIEIIRWVDYTRRRLTGAKRSEITPQLYLGGQYGLKMTPRLKKFGITAIVNMRQHSVHAQSIAQGYDYLHLPTPDWHAPSLEHLHQGVTFITKVIASGGKVYIHCRLGEGRGPTMALAYLMSTGLTLEDALSTVKKVRPFIRPSGAQIAQLKNFGITLAV